MRSDSSHEIVARIARDHGGEPCAGFGILRAQLHQRMA